MWNGDITSVTLSDVELGVTAVIKAFKGHIPGTYWLGCACR